ncbi:MAG: hypothetical protein IJH40_07885 [Ruminococcus sp.]|uniref:GDSL-type esterase/lipase family protein n=1 Tax=Ruminococcus sp. TaxID=41978 RepID=UPI0028735EC1|nr:GDSL-type esterase/lipase family protein [Ruminococcus sp.]MBQ3285544.1 hypothetical protein [Ruminococcus sp.]
MIKRGFSLISALLIILTALANTVLSAGAEEIVSDVSTGIEYTTVGIGEEYPTVSDIKNEINGVRLTWNSFGDYSRYRVYYQKAVSDSDVWEEKYNNDGWTELAVVEGTGYLHTNVDDTERGIYTVCAVDNQGEDASAFKAEGWENRFYAAPEIKAVTIDENGVHLAWDRIGTDGSERYRILRRSADEDEFAVIASGIDGSTYIDRTFVPGNEYVYTLCLTDRYDHVISGFTSGVSTLSAYTEITSIVNTADGAKISWLPFIGAAKYRIYYRSGGTWVRLAEVSGTAYTDTQARDGETRVYTVRCVNESGAFVSGFYRDGWSNTFFAPPVIKKISFGDSGYTVSWSAYSAIYAYRVYRRNYGDTELTELGDMIGYSFTDSTVEEEAIVSYALCAVDENGEPVSAVSEESVYYQNGSPADAVFEDGDKVYRLSDGVPADGYFREGDVNYYYKNGLRVEHNWYRTGRFQTIYDRTQWLYELMKYSGALPGCSSGNSKAVFELAKQRGIISSYSDADFNASVDRLFVAQTMVKALGYPQRKVGTVSDSSDTSLSTIAYFGYFIPDINNKLYPKALVKDEEFDSLISELKLCKKLKGKKLTVFGDSVMFGYGNPVGTTYEGIADIIGIKYGMDYKKYAKSGAVMGKTSGKSHIADQVRTAIDAGRKSDLIILNGGTNDAWHTDIKLGDITDGYDMSSIGESNYTNAFEKTMWLIKNEWKNTPVIYVRSHRMKLGTKARQESIGERALALCEKWKVAGIDLYNDSELNGNVLEISQRYTWDNDTLNRGIHPNALGYAEFYLPPIGENIASLFELSLVGDCNADGEVDIIDVYYLQRYIAALPTDADETAMMSGDVDGSGTLDIIDATYIQRGLAGLDISPYVIGENI